VSVSWFEGIHEKLQTIMTLTAVISGSVVTVNHEYALFSIIHTLPLFLSTLYTCLHVVHMFDYLLYLK